MKNSTTKFTICFKILQFSGKSIIIQSNPKTSRTYPLFYFVSRLLWKLILENHFIWNYMNIYSSGTTIYLSNKIQFEHQQFNKKCTELIQRINFMPNHSRASYVILFINARRWTKLEVDPIKWLCNITKYSSTC